MMSATQSRSGPATWKSRCTRSGAERASASRVVVVTHLRRLTPCTWAARMSRATRLPDVNALGGQLGLHPRPAIGPARLEVNGADCHRQLGVVLRARREGAVLPRIVPTGGDPEHAAHGGDRVGGLVTLHEFESREGIDVVSLANQAAAFRRISRSSRSTRTSRRRRRTSSFSSVVRPSARRPSSRAACTTQFRMALAEGSNLRASSSGLCPPRTSSTSRCRDSAVYGRRVLGIGTSFLPQRIGVHQTGASPGGQTGCGWQRAAVGAAVLGGADPGWLQAGARQGGDSAGWVISPLLANIYLARMDRVLE